MISSKQLSLMAKNIPTNFIMFQSNDKKMHVAYDIVFVRERIYDVGVFITDVNAEHVKKYIYELFHNHDIDTFESYTDYRNCSYPYNDLKIIVHKCGVKHIIADNNGYYGFV